MNGKKMGIKKTVTAATLKKMPGKTAYENPESNSGDRQIGLPS